MTVEPHVLQKSVSNSELFAAFDRARAQGWKIEVIGLHEAMLRHPDGRTFNLRGRNERKVRGQRRRLQNRARFLELVSGEVQP